ncbi:MAG: pseudouridine synthase [Candidatus Saccharibacteria bacterium]
MRINKYIALATGYSRRGADELIAAGRVRVNGEVPKAGIQINDLDIVSLDNHPIAPPLETITILYHKPSGYVVSRDGQGSQTIYDLLPVKYHELKPVGRLDKYSSGLLLLTNDGQLANELTHPRYAKIKIYEIGLNNPLAPLHRQMISEHGIMLDDGVSKLQLERLHDGDDTQWRITMHEGRNRQIRRTFASLGYHVKQLHRTHFGDHRLDGLGVGKLKII